MQKMYISRFFVEELRHVYNEKEREVYMKKNNAMKPVRLCSSPTSNYCFRALQQCNVIPNMHKFNAFRAKNILQNVKFYHFVQNDVRPKKVYDRLTFTILTEIAPGLLSLSRNNSSQSEKGIAERLSTAESESSHPPMNNQSLFDSVLIERQQHACGFYMETEDDKQTRLMTKRDGLLQDLYMIENDVIGDALKYLKPGRRRDISMSPNGKSHEAAYNIMDSDVEDDFGEQGLSDILMKEPRTSPKRGVNDHTPPSRNHAIKGSMIK